MPSLLPALNALPAYPGSKRRLVDAVFGLIDEALPRAQWPLSTVADAFLGAGSVSIYAKAQGWGEVFANDISERSALVGRGIIANSGERLELGSVLRLQTVASAVLSGPAILSRLQPATRPFFANASRHLRANSFCGVQADLISVLVMKTLSRQFPMGIPSASDALHVATGDFDRVSPARLKHYLRAARSATHPRTLLRLREQINGGILPGRARFTQLDVFAFLDGLAADVLYLDPPYAGTSSYESAFALLDDFFGAPPLPPSRFSGRKPPLDELLDAARHVPVLLLSLNNAIFSEDELRALVSRHRLVQRLIAIPYRHFGPLATVAKNRANREILVLGVQP